MKIVKEWGKQDYCDFCKVLWADFQLKNGSVACEDCCIEMGIVVRK